MRVNKTVSSLSCYEAAYYYCPQDSIVVASRHNTIFDNEFADEIIAAKSEKYNLMLANYRVNGKEIVLLKNIGYNSSSRASELYNRHFMHFQIFKSDLLKSISPQLLKVD